MSDKRPESREMSDELGQFQLTETTTNLGETLTAFGLASGLVVLLVDWQIVPRVAN